MKSTFGSRLREARRDAGLTQKLLASKAGIKQATVSELENDKYLGSAYAAQLAAATGVNALWLADGKGDKHISASADKSNKGHKSGIISASTAAGRDTLEATGERKIDQNATAAPPDQRRIPVISYAQAAMMTDAVDPFAPNAEQEMLETDLDVSEQTFALIIEGTSMFPEFSEGDKVIIDPAERPRPTDFVVAMNAEKEVTFRKYRPRGTNERGEMVFELAPLNDDFPTLNSERDNLRIIGVMVEHRRYRRR